MDHPTTNHELLLETVGRMRKETARIEAETAKLADNSASISGREDTIGEMEARRKRLHELGVPAKIIVSIDGMVAKPKSELARQKRRMSAHTQE